MGRWRGVAVAWMAAAGLLAGPVTAQRIRLPENLRTLEERAARDSNDAAAHFNVALAYWNEHRWEDVERSLRTALAIEYRFAEANLALAYLQRVRLDQYIEAAGRGDSAALLAADETRLRYHRRAIMFDPFVNDRLARVIPDCRRCPRTRITRGEVLAILFAYYAMHPKYWQALGDLADGRADRAYDRLNDVIRDYRDDPDGIPSNLLWAHATAAWRVQQPNVAIADVRMLLSRAEDMERDSTLSAPLRTNEFRYILAWLQQREGRLDEAVALYREVLVADLGQYMAHVRLAEVFEATGRWPDAIRERQEADVLNPDDPTNAMELGLTLVRAGRLADADAALASAAARAPRDSRIAYYQGIVASQRGDAAAARAHFERFLSLAPSREEGQIADARRRIDALR